MKADDCASMAGVIDRASALVRAGSVVSFPRGDEEVIVVRVEGLAERRRPL